MVYTIIITIIRGSAIIECTERERERERERESRNMHMYTMRYTYTCFMYVLYKKHVMYIVT